VFFFHLVKDGLVWADEAPLEHLLLAVRILDGVADVEDLAVVGHVRVVAVPLTLATELVHYVLPVTEVHKLIGIQ